MPRNTEETPHSVSLKISNSHYQFLVGLRKNSGLYTANLMRVWIDEKMKSGKIPNTYYKHGKNTTAISFTCVGAHYDFLSHLRESMGVSTASFIRDLIEEKYQDSLSNTAN